MCCHCSCGCHVEEQRWQRYVPTCIHACNDTCGDHNHNVEIMYTAVWWLSSSSVHSQARSTYQEYVNDLINV